MDITVRKATESDAELLAWAMLESSRAGKRIGIFDLIFETDETDVLLERLGALTVTGTKSFCHFSNFLVAEDRQVGVGTLCGYESRIATQDAFTEALVEVGVDGNYQERIAAFLLVAPEIDRQTWVLDFMTAIPGYDPLPVFEVLLKKSLLTARLKGYRKAQTMVEIGSVDAEMVYKKLGFQVVDDKQSRLYVEQFGRPGIKRLQMNL